ncbi:MAG TPA: site-specific DNA-methyltransferase [Candidatus Kapabacteria bacterium]|jgi:site-specific DNA-methyltransferase (adenine-specific)|nr:site-specific DNA-methyltransferase [Candidatus Kapabacteria bacterium]
MATKLNTRKKGTETSSFGTMGRINHNSNKFYRSNLYKDIKINAATDYIENIIPDILLNTIVLGNSENMGAIPDNSVHLMITSPPYNVSKEYDENLSLDDYLTLLKNVFNETYRVLVNGGRACINIANIGRKPYIPLSDYVSKIMQDIGFLMRGEIIWDKGAGAGVSMAWGSWQSASNPVLRDTHEYILIFSKGDFQRDAKGKTNTITKEQFMEWTKSIWSINPESAKRVNHPAPFPEELPYRLIQLYSFKNDVVLDPFMGSGTTAISALKSNRAFIGYEINEEYVKIANKRIEILRNQLNFEFE